MTAQCERTIVTLFYGTYIFVYNIHNVIYLVDDTKAFTGRDNCSVFPFESFNEKIKKMVCSEEDPLTQIERL